MTNNLNKKSGKPAKMLMGWQEWCALPKLHLPAIKAKIDTGAKTSALHASDIHPFHRHGLLYVHFIVHPLQRNKNLEKYCTAQVIDQRVIMNSGGQKEYRYVIETPISIGEATWNIEITLTNREPLAFRMLLGRDALKGHVMIDPGKILGLGHYSIKTLKALYL